MCLSGLSFKLKPANMQLLDNQIIAYRLTKVNASLRYFKAFHLAIRTMCILGDVVNCKCHI